MSTHFLLDTCDISDYFKKNPQVIHHFQKVAPSQLHVSTITAMEIEYGLKLSPEREKKLRPLWEALTALITVLPFSEKDAAAAAQLRAKLKPTGKLIGPYDILLAGVAHSHNLVFVTSNTKEFQRLHELQLQNWRDEA